MKVSMLKQTRWEGEALHPGDETKVDEVVGKRWVQKGIAEALAPEQNKSNGSTGGKGKEVDEELAELQERAKNLGINNWHKMKKETLQSKIDEYQVQFGEALDKAAQIGIEGYEDMSLDELNSAIQKHNELMGAAIDKAVELGIEGYEEKNLEELQATIADAEKED